MNKRAARAGVVGATGYSGQEILALLRRHPRLEAGFATSESETGAAVAGSGLRYIPVAEAPLGEVDVVFTCLPTGESGAWAERAARAGTKVVDLSADLRDGSSGAVYGLTELWRDEVAGADVVANPGCYPTAILLGLAPAARFGLLEEGRAVVIDAASGVTGAGRAAKRDMLFGEVAEDYRAYGVGNRHRHVPEIRAGLARLGDGAAVPFVFTPHLLPVRRGILATMVLPLRAPFSAAEAAAAWGDAYGDEPCVEVWREGTPGLRASVGRNVAVVGFSDVSVDAPTLLVVVSIDNLVKGAAGQAVQNANLMLGFDELEGLPL